MTEIEIGFRPVVGDENLAVLVGTHGARINVDVRIHLEHRHFEAPAFQQRADRCRRKAFAQRRNHATGDENELGFYRRHSFLSFNPLCR